LLAVFAALFAVFLMTAPPASAAVGDEDDPYRISGNVQLDGEPLEAVHLTIDGPGGMQEVETDENGQWRVGVPEKNALTVAAATAGLAALLALPLFGVSVLVAILLAGLVTAGFSALCRRMIDGHTGDTIGAAQQLAEAAVLVGLSAGFARGIGATTYLLV